MREPLAETVSLERGVLFSGPLEVQPVRARDRVPALLLWQERCLQDVQGAHVWEACSRASRAGSACLERPAIADAPSVVWPFASSR